MKVSPKASINKNTGPPDRSTFLKEFPPWVASGSPAIKNLEDEATLRKSEQNTYYDSLKPIFFFLTITGIWPVYRLRIGSHKVDVVITSGLCLVIYIIFAYLTHLETLEVLQLIFHDDNFSFIIIQVTLIMLLCQHKFYLFLTWPESICVNKYFIQWKEFQIIAAYNVTMYIIRTVQGTPEDTQEALATAAAFLFYGTLIYMFCDCGHCMTTEMRLFLRSLRSAPPLASLSGYVTVNRRAFLHLSGILVTYVIILVQFNISSIQTESFIKLTQNKTN